MKTAKRWAKTWKRAKSGKNGQASLNLMRQHALLILYEMAGGAVLMM
jgi:hypothetical protein